MTTQQIEEILREKLPVYGVNICHKEGTACGGCDNCSGASSITYEELVNISQAAAAIALRLATLADEALEKERKPLKNNTPQEHIDLKYINTSAGKI